LTTEKVFLLNYKKTVAANNVIVSFAAFVVVIAGMKASTEILVPFLLAVFIAVLCTPLMVWLKVRKVPSSLAVLLVVVMFFLLAATFGTVIGASLSAFYQDLPDYEQKLQLQSQAGVSWLKGMGVEVDQSIIRDYINPSAAMKMVAQVFSGLGGVLTNAFLILFSVVFILVEASDFPDKVRRALGHQTTALESFQRFSDSVQRYLLIKTLISIGTGIFAGVALALIGVDYAVLWGLIAFLLNYIPNIGSILAAIPPMLIAMIQLGPMSSLLVAGVYVTINTLFGNVIEPRFMGRSLGLSTLVVFVSLIFWGWVFGPVGMLLSIPLTMVVKIALEGSKQHHWMSVLLGH
jgi:predicted PurR-regulated permease PerM|tara:strand:- start:234 stop:1277 length:1044 start_codon:yes stop_codon:yes gene_type:complete